jgi:hypothetical protein
MMQEGTDGSPSVGLLLEKAIPQQSVKLEQALVAQQVVAASAASIVPPSASSSASAFSVVPVASETGSASHLASPVVSKILIKPEQTTPTSASQQLLLPAVVAKGPAAATLMGTLGAFSVPIQSSVLPPATNALLVQSSPQEGDPKASALAGVPILPLSTSKSGFQVPVPPILNKNLPTSDRVPLSEANAAVAAALLMRTGSLASFPEAEATKRRGKGKVASKPGATKKQKERAQHPSPQAASTQAKMGNKFKLVSVEVKVGKKVISVTLILRPIPIKTEPGKFHEKMAPYFIVREIDHKMLRTGKAYPSAPTIRSLLIFSHRHTGEQADDAGSSEQSKRAHIRSTVVKLNFDHDTASKEELVAIKKRDKNILGVIAVHLFDTLNYFICFAAIW